MSVLGSDEPRVRDVFEWINTVATEVQFHFVFVQHFCKPTSTAPMFAPDRWSSTMLMKLVVNLVHVTLQSSDLFLVLDLNIITVRVTYSTSGHLIDWLIERSLLSSHNETYMCTHENTDVDFMCRFKVQTIYQIKLQRDRLTKSEWASEKNLTPHPEA